MACKTVELIVRIPHLFLILLVANLVGCGASDDDGGLSNSGFPPPSGHTFDATPRPEGGGSDTGHDESDGCTCPRSYGPPGSLWGPCRSDGAPQCDDETAADGRPVSCREYDSGDGAMLYCLPTSPIGGPCSDNYTCAASAYCDFGTGTCQSADSGAGGSQGAGGAGGFQNFGGSF